MKALSLWQPWATLMVTGWKRIETRSWATNHRGLIAIHATKAFPREARELLTEEPFAQALHGQSLPKGAIVGMGELLRCTQMTEESVAFMEEWKPLEHAFGLYQPGRYAWVFGKITRFSEPIPCNGAQQLWDVRGEAAQALQDRLERAVVKSERAVQLALGEAA